MPESLLQFAQPSHVASWPLELALSVADSSGPPSAGQNCNGHPKRRRPLPRRSAKGKPWHWARRWFRGTTTTVEHQPGGSKVSAMATDGTTLDCFLDILMTFSTVCPRESWSHADGSSGSPFNFPAWEVGQKECFTFELELTVDNLANMARFRSQQVSCECAVLPTKRGLQVECKLPLNLRKGFQPVASTNNTDSLFQRARR